MKHLTIHLYYEDDTDNEDVPVEAAKSAVMAIYEKHDIKCEFAGVHIEDVEGTPYDQGAS